MVFSWRRRLDLHGCCHRGLKGIGGRGCRRCVRIWIGLSQAHHRQQKGIRQKMTEHGVSYGKIRACRRGREIESSHDGNEGRPFAELLGRSMCPRSSLGIECTHREKSKRSWGEWSAGPWSLASQERRTMVRPIHARHAETEHLSIVSALTKQERYRSRKRRFDAPARDEYRSFPVYRDSQISAWKTTRLVREVRCRWEDSSRFGPSPQQRKAQNQ